MTINALGQQPEYSISAQEFDEIEKANGARAIGLGFEQKFDLVIENYAETERTLIDMALDHSIFPGRIEAILEEAALLANRRILNFLSTARLYLDQARHNLSYLFGANALASFNRDTSREYDSRLGYRVMEALRNYSQHRGLPVEWITFPAGWDDSKAPRMLRFSSAIPGLSVDNVRRNGGFKASVLSELEPRKDRHANVALLPFMRDYVDGLGIVHASLRDRTGAALAAADALVSMHRTKYEGMAPNIPLAGLAAVETDQYGKFRSRQPLTTRPTEKRLRLLAKNVHLDTVGQRFVTSDYRRD